MEVKSEDIAIDIDGVKTFTPSYDQRPEEVPFTEWFWEKVEILKIAILAKSSRGL